MDFAELYHFLFETIEGIGCLIVACLVLTTIIAAILEYRTRKTFKDRGEKTKTIGSSKTSSPSAQRPCTRPSPRFRLAIPQHGRHSAQEQVPNDEQQGNGKHAQRRASR